MIAAANALESDGDLVAGATLTVPEVKASSNDANTFKPYNPGEITGPTSPGLPYIPSADAGCNKIAAVIRVVVAAVLMVVPMGQLAAMAVAGLGEGLAQTVEINGGQRQGYDWGGVAVSAVSAGIGAEAGTSWINKAQSAAGAYSRVAVVTAGKAALNYTGGYTINKALGEDVHFSWKELTISSVTTAITSTLLGGSSPRAGANGLATNTMASVAFSWKDLALEAVRSVARQGVGHVVRDAIKGDAHWNWNNTLQAVVQDVAIVGLAGLMVNSENRRAIEFSARAEDERVDDRLIALAFSADSTIHERDESPIRWGEAYTLASNGPDFSSLQQWGGEHVKFVLSQKEAELSNLNNGHHVVNGLDDARNLLVGYLGTDDSSMIEAMSRNPISFDGPRMAGQLNYQPGQANRLNLNEPFFGETIATIYVTRGVMAALGDKFEGRGLADAALLSSFERSKQRHDGFAANYSDPGVDHMPVHARIGHSKAMGSAAVVEGILSGAASLYEVNRRMEDFMIIGVYQSSGKRTFLVTNFQQAIDRRNGNAVRWIPVMTSREAADYKYLIQGGKK